MYDFGFFCDDERLEDLLGESADVADGEAVELADLEQVVEGDVEQLEGEEDVVPEGEEVLEFDDPGADVVPLALVQHVEDLDLGFALVVVGLLVFNDFDGADPVALPLNALDHLAEGALPQQVDDHVLGLYRTVGLAQLQNRLVHTQNVIVVFIVVAFVQNP